MAKSNKKVNATTRKQKNQITAKENALQQKNVCGKQVKGHLVFQMVEELKGILLEAAEDMKPSFHPNRWDIVLVYLEEDILCIFYDGLLPQIQPWLPTLSQRNPRDWLVCLQLVKLNTEQSK